MDLAVIEFMLEKRFAYAREANEIKNNLIEQLGIH